MVLTTNKLKELLEYNPESGLFVWRVSRGAVKAGGVAGSITTNGYVKIVVDGNNYQSHRLAVLYMTGTMPVYPEQEVDHVNHVRDDNRWSNLRVGSRQENQRNASLRKDNESGVTGVRWMERISRWTAVITVDSKKIHLGSFVRFSDAVDARKNAEVLYGFHKNHGETI